MMLISFLGFLFSEHRSRHVHAPKREVGQIRATNTLNDGVANLNVPC
jgi:hypothetical protein